MAQSDEGLTASAGRSTAGAGNTVLAGKYELRSVLGKGGMGVVYRGEHLGTGRAIAVKVLRRELMSDATLAKRFMREAKAAAALQHPNVVDILDYGVDTDGTAYQVLELLEGESLGDHLARKGRISVDVALCLMMPVIHALAMAHARGVVHRDLKPDNVFLARNAHERVVPKLLDFGIAKLMRKDGDTNSTIATRVGSAIGTPAYMSPEQASGTGDVGTATDVWAVGVILFECLAGRVPFEAETGSIMMARIITEQAASLGAIAPEVPAPLVAVIDRALRQDQTERWTTMAAFGEALREAAAASDVVIAPPGASDVAPMSMPPPRRESELLEDEEVFRSGSEDDELLRPPTTRVTPERPGTAVTLPARGRRELRPETREHEAAPQTEPPRARRPALIPIAVVSIVLVVSLVFGFWMRDSPTVAAAPNVPVAGPTEATEGAPIEPAAPIELAAPIAPAAPIELAAPIAATPTEVPELREAIAIPANTEEVAAPRGRRRLTSSAVRGAPDEPAPAPHAPRAPSAPGSLPELTDW